MAEDIPDNHTNNYNHATLPISLLTELKAGKTTLKDIHKVFGSEEADRLTFKKHPLPKLYGGQSYLVYRIVRYDSAHFNRKESPGVIETSVREVLMITFFFDKNDVLMFSAVRHRLRRPDGNDYNGKHHKMLGDPKQAWPGATCDSMFHSIYETNRYQGSQYFGPVTTQKCQWLDKLKADVARGVVK